MITRFDAAAAGFALILVLEIIMLIRRLPAKRNLLIVFFSAYIVFLISMVFFPVFLKSDGTNADYNFIPFASIKNYFSIKKTYSFIAVAGNIILLIPWGLFFKSVFRKARDAVFWISTVAFCAGIEITQHLINLMLGYRIRCVDVDDFILNMAGAVTGFVLYRFCFIKICKLLKKQ